ncbi:hypothetical protein E2C01_072043 [Portunus trituberculatus]|uniref:Uncharacterized protein n=1 Tax=Portunus trituberculatus TaxID=210409 RepID=A0A5B7I6Q2_PORTR|nr:hypothetical protein [Portunus trituberculatus]
MDLTRQHLTVHPFLLTPCRRHHHHHHHHYHHCPARIIPPNPKYFTGKFTYLAKHLGNLLTLHNHSHHPAPPHQTVITTTHLTSPHITSRLASLHPAYHPTHLLLPS